MAPPWIASVQLVCGVSLLVLLAGCGTATNTKASQPTGPGPTAVTVPITPSGLQLGFTWQPNSGNLYPILGVTGSGRYGDGVLPEGLNVATAAAAVSTSSTWALVLRKDGTLQEWEFPASTSITLATGIANDARILFSPSGTSGWIVSSSTAVVVSGLPSQPQVASLPLPPGFSPGQIAVSDAGTALVGLKLPGTAGLAWGAMSETRSYAAVGTIQTWGGAGFVPGTASDAAVVADGTSAQLLNVTNLSGTSPTVTLLPSAGILQKPAGIGISADGKWVYAADGAKPQIVRISLLASGPAPSSIPCACTPQQMVPLTVDGIYSITPNLAGQPDWILDTRTLQPRTFFVPANARSTAGQASALSTALSNRMSR